MSELIYEDLSYKVRGCFFSVYNELGFGHKEKVYQKALAVEFEKEKIPFEREKSLPVMYNNQKVGTYAPDFIIQNTIIVEVKAVPVMQKSAEAQLTYYLKGTNYQLGLLVNFGSEKIDIRRRIWSPK